MLRAILNKSWRQHPTRHQVYGHLPPITKTFRVRRTRHAGHCWRSRDKLISHVLLWTPTYGRAKAGRPTRTYIQQLCEDTGCSPEDLSEALNVREKWRERVRDIRASGTTWWWWWYIYIYIYIYCPVGCDVCDLGNVDHSFITIAPRSTLAWNASTWEGPINGSNRTKCILVLNWILWNRTVWLNWIA